MYCCITKMRRLIIIVYISQAYVDFFRILYYFSMLKLLYNATSSFERNFTEISQLQAQRRNEIRVMNDPPSIKDQVSVEYKNNGPIFPQPGQEQPR